MVSALSCPISSCLHASFTLALLSLPVMKFDYAAEENQSSTSKQEQDGKMSLGQAQSGDSDFAADFSAAKVAAMKAAELGKI